MPRKLIFSFAALVLLACAAPAAAEAEGCYGAGNRDGCVGWAWDEKYDWCIGKSNKEMTSCTGVSVEGSVASR